MQDQDSFIDFYEVLQISPTAELETIRRVYRLLALRYHPDNKESGNQSEFEMVFLAYRTLSDPEKRAAFDVKHQEHQKLRWKIFDQEGALTSREIEKRQRDGILSIMYAKRLQENRNPGVTMRELESLLNCAREHLEFSLWYLRERGHIRASDSGTYWITVGGVDWCNEAESGKPAQDDESRRLMIEAGRRNGNEEPTTNANGHQAGRPATPRRDPVVAGRAPESQNPAWSGRPTAPPT